MLYSVCIVVTLYLMLAHDLSYELRELQWLTTTYASPLLEKICVQLEVYIFLFFIIYLGCIRNKPRPRNTRPIIKVT